MKATFLLIPALIFCGIVSMAQKHNETITEERSFRVSDGKEVFYIANIIGSVEIIGTKEDQLTIEVDKTILAKNSTDLETGVEEIQLEIIELDDGYYVFIKTGYSFFDYENRRVKYDYCGVNWDDYDFHCDFKVLVPEKVKLYASTVNNGNILVENILGDHKVMNVNGSITLKDVSGNTTAHTVNGDVNVNYRNTPTGNCSYETINGDITVSVPGNLSAEIEVDTFNGDFFTSYENIRSKGNRVEKTRESHDKGTTYKISSRPVFQIGEGDMKLSFNSFNGDMYLVRRE